MTREEQAGYVVIAIVLFTWWMLHLGIIQGVLDAAIGALVALAARCIGHE